MLIQTTMRLVSHPVKLDLKASCGMPAVTALQTAAGLTILQAGPWRLNSASPAQLPLTRKVADACSQHEHGLLNNPDRQSIKVTLAP